jgi:hypothetical protein
MTASVDLRELERRPRKYWNEDGLPELVMGLLWIVWGGAWLIGNALPRGPVWNVFWMFTPALLALSGVAAVRLTKALKARVTFPRTGYVQWKAPTGGQRVATAAVAMVTAAVLAALIVKSRADGLERVAAPGMGVLLSLGFLVASITQRAPHLLALGGVALALGLAFGALGAGWEAMNWMLVALGAAAAVMGAARFRMFLARNPRESRE